MFTLHLRPLFSTIPPDLILSPYDVWCSLPTSPLIPESLIISQSEQGKSINPMTTTNRFSRRFVLDGEINLAHFMIRNWFWLNLIWFYLIYCTFYIDVRFVFTTGRLSLHCIAPSVTFFIAFWEDIPRGRRRRRRWCQDGQQLQEGLTTKASSICTTLKTLMDFWFGLKTRPLLPT